MQVLDVARVCCDAPSPSGARRRAHLLLAQDAARRIVAAQPAWRTSGGGYDEFFALEDAGRSASELSGGVSVAGEYFTHDGRNGNLCPRPSSPLTLPSQAQIDTDATALIASVEAAQGAARFRSKRYTFPAWGVAGGAFPAVPVLARVLTLADRSMRFDVAGTWHFELEVMALSRDPAIGATVTLQLWIDGALATSFSAVRAIATGGNAETSVPVPFVVSHTATVGGPAVIELRVAGDYDVLLTTGSIRGATMSDPSIEIVNVARLWKE